GQVSARHQPTNQIGEAINIRLQEGRGVGAGEITVGADEVGLELDAGFAALDHRAEDAEDLCSGITTATASAAAISSVRRTASAARPPSRSMLYIGRSSMRGQLTSKESGSRRAIASASLRLMERASDVEAGSAPLAGFQR